MLPDLVCSFKSLKSMAPAKAGLFRKLNERSIMALIPIVLVFSLLIGTGKAFDTQRLNDRVPRLLLVAVF